MHKAVWDTVQHVRTITAQRRAAEKLYWELYMNQLVTGLESTNKLDSQFNLIAQAVDTAAAQIIRSHKPKYTTTDADFNLQRMARKLTQVTEGQLLDLGCDDVMSQLFVSGAVTGTGHALGYVTEDGDIKVEHCMPGSVLVDPRDGQRENPYTRWYRVPIARDVLLASNPNKGAVIEKAAAPSMTDRQDLWLAPDSTVDDVMVVYGWKRPTTPKSNDGRFVVCTSLGSLIDEDWNEEHPIITYRWKHRPGSYYGIGLAEAGLLSQARYRRYEERVERAESGPTAWILNDKRNKVRVEKLTNEAYALVTFDGSEGVGPPAIVHYTNTPSDFVAQQERVREQFLAEQGISPLSAQGTKPAGLNSAVSQRTYQEITSVRQRNQAEGFAGAYVDLFQLITRLNRRAAKMRDDDYTVVARTTRGRVPMVSEVAWSEVDLPENKYRVACWPISDIPTTPSGKEELVSEWIASGMTQRNFAQNLVMQSTLDTDVTSRLELADMDRTMYDLERIEDGFTVAPDPYVNMAIAADIARRAYVHRSCQNVPEEILAALREYVDACVAADEQAKAQAAAKAAAMQPQSPAIEQAVGV